MCAQKAVSLGFADKIMYWDEESGSDTVSNDVRQMLPKLSLAMDEFFEGRNTLKTQPMTSKIDDRVSKDALMRRLILISH